MRAMRSKGRSASPSRVTSRPDRAGPRSKECRSGADTAPSDSGPRGAREFFSFIITSSCARRQAAGGAFAEIVSLRARILRVLGRSGTPWSTFIVRTTARPEVRGGRKLLGNPSPRAARRKPAGAGRRPDGRDHRRRSAILRPRGATFRAVPAPAGSLRPPLAPGGENCSGTRPEGGYRASSRRHTSPNISLPNAIAHSSFSGQEQDQSCARCSGVVSRAGSWCWAGCSRPRSSRPGTRSRSPAGSSSRRPDRHVDEPRDAC